MCSDVVKYALDNGYLSEAEVAFKARAELGLPTSPPGSVVGVGKEDLREVLQAVKAFLGPSDPKPALSRLLDAVNLRW